MKKIILLTAILLLFISCQDVIDIDLPNEKPRLVIDASIDWIIGTDGKEQDIKLTLSSPFFSTESMPANGAQVTINDSNGNTFNFTEDGNTGIYKTSNFIAKLNEEYEITIIYKGETYKGKESLIPVVKIDEITANYEGGINKDEISIKAYYTDPKDERNFYYFKFTNDIPTTPQLEIRNDDFFDKQTSESYDEGELLKVGTKVTIKMHGVSERFFDFMSVIKRQLSNEGGPFETQPAIVRGNCVNTTNKENFPFGYFRVSQVDKKVYTIQ